MKQGSASLEEIGHPGAFDEIIDVRSPAEFAEDHIPGATNCPVLDNEQRIEVGTLYKQASPFEARRIGAAYVAENIARHLREKFLDRPKTWRPLIVCWRGGQRSGSMTLIFRRIGWDACQLEGGYKVYRKQVVEALAELPRRLRLKVVCGATGSGKSRILQALARLGEQVLDLEELACHKGSVLGVLPDQPQPSQKAFESRLLLALRAAGEQLGWGFQLQSPAIVALLAALFTLLGLNLAGMFEFGSMLPGSWAAAHARHPVADAFLSGVLAVAIASPCTAPFMGASLGFAIDMPAPQALTVFAALGLGMALPYLLASFVPAVVRWLPRPGAWMDTFRRAMAFPMFATVVWLVWVLGHQSGMDAAAALLALLLAFSALVWTLTLQGRTRAVLATLVVALSGALLATALPLITTPARAEGSPAQAASGERWQPWSATRVAELQAQGKPVFVDYTAAWCVTCQVNKRTTLSHEEVLAAFDRHGVALLRADWTRRDPAITAALQQLGRSGVPVYVLHAPGKPPVVLSELLSRGEVLQALDTL